MSQGRNTAVYDQQEKAVCSLLANVKHLPELLIISRGNTFAV